MYTKICQVFLHHEMFSTEDNPEGEEHGVEDSLTNVSEQQHPRPVESDGEPLHWYVDEGHRDPQCKDHPEYRQTSPQGSDTSSIPSSIIISSKSINMMLP